MDDDENARDRTRWSDRGRQRCSIKDQRSSFLEHRTVLFHSITVIRTDCTCSSTAEVCDCDTAAFEAHVHGVKY
jgi:hypothetical protein